MRLSHLRSLLSVVAVAGACTLTGCALLDGPAPDAPQRQKVEVPQEAVKYVPGGSAEDNLPYFRKVISDYGASDKPLEVDEIENALSDAGFLREDMQNAGDHDPYGVALDSVYVSVRFDKECLIGQIATADRQVTVERLDAIGPNHKTCLIAKNQRSGN